MGLIELILLSVVFIGMIAVIVIVLKKKDEPENLIEPEELEEPEEIIPTLCGPLYLRKTVEPVNASYEDIPNIASDPLYNVMVADAIINDNQVIGDSLAPLNDLIIDDNSNNIIEVPDDTPTSLDNDNVYTDTSNDDSSSNDSSNDNSD